MMITGQGNGQGGREHGQKADQLPGMRSITDPEHRRYIAGVWGVDEKEIPGAGLTAVEIMNAIHAGEIKALFSMCFNPVVSLPDSNFVREALNKLASQLNGDAARSSDRAKAQKLASAVTDLAGATR